MPRIAEISTELSKSRREELSCDNHNKPIFPSIKSFHIINIIFFQTALEYYNAACQYGDKKLQEKCFKWFLVNLMPYYFNHPISELKSIPITLMSKLVNHPDLFVIQTEYSIYVMLKYWVYLQANPDNDKPSLKDINSYFSSKSGII